MLVPSALVIPLHLRIAFKGCNNAIATPLSPQRVPFGSGSPTVCMYLYISRLSRRFFHLTHPRCLVSFLLHPPGRLRCFERACRVARWPIQTHYLLIHRSPTKNVANDFFLSRARMRGPLNHIWSHLVTPQNVCISAWNVCHHDNVTTHVLTRPRRPHFRTFCFLFFYFCSFIFMISHTRRTARKQRSEARPRFTNGPSLILDFFSPRVKS